MTGLEPLAIMAIAGAGVSAAGTVVSGFSQATSLEQDAANRIAISDFETEAAAIRAQNERASGSRNAQEILRKLDLEESTLIARAASSGAGVMNPTIAQLLEGNAEFAFGNAHAELFKGEDRARGILDQAAIRAASAKATASARKKTAKSTRTASLFQAAATVLSGIGGSGAIGGKSLASPRPTGGAGLGPQTV